MTMSPPSSLLLPPTQPVHRVGHSEQVSSLTSPHLMASIVHAAPRFLIRRFLDMSRPWARPIGLPVTSSTVQQTLVLSSSSSHLHAPLPRHLHAHLGHLCYCFFPNVHLLGLLTQLNFDLWDGMGSRRPLRPYDYDEHRCALLAPSPRVRTRRRSTVPISQAQSE